MKFEDYLKRELESDGRLRDEFDALELEYKRIEDRLKLNKDSEKRMEMSDKERFIEIIQNSVGGCARHWAEIIADGLIEQGAILPPCKVGTHLWRVTIPYRKQPKVTEFIVKNFRTVGKKHNLQIEVQALNVPMTNWMYYSDFYVTKEEAIYARNRRADDEISIDKHKT